MNDIKNDILKTCLEHFLQYGIREMSNDKLAVLLGISTKTLYKYFDNKEHLLEQAYYLFQAQQYHMLESLPAGQKGVCQFFDIWSHGVEIEYNVNKAFFRELHYYYPGMAEKVEASISKKFKQQFLRIINRGIKEGSFSQDIIPELVLEGIFVLYTTLVRTEHFKTFRLSSSTAFLNTIAVYIRGFCTAQGTRILDEHIAGLGIPSKQNRRKEKKMFSTA